jgi:hypothetical protein
MFPCSCESEMLHEPWGVAKTDSTVDLLTIEKYFVMTSSIPVTGRGCPEGCETSRLPHFLDNRLKYGGEVVNLTRRPSFTLQEDSWYSFLLEAESISGPSAAGRISWKKSTSSGFEPAIFWLVALRLN